MLKKETKENLKKALTDYEYRKANAHNQGVIINLLTDVVGSWLEEDESVRVDYFEGRCPVFPPESYVVYWIENKDLIQFGYVLSFVNMLIWNDKI